MVYTRTQAMLCLAALLLPFSQALHPDVNLSSPSVTVLTDTGDPPSQQAALAAKEVRRYIYAGTGRLLPLKLGRCTEEHLSVAAAPLGSIVLLNGSCINRTVSHDQEHTLHRWKGTKGGVLLIGGRDDVTLLHAAYRYAELAVGVHFGIGGDTIPRRSFASVLKRIQQWSSDVEVATTPVFSVRGLNPFHDFAMGPDLWEAENYKVYITQMAKMRLNFIGLHNYNYYNEEENFTRGTGITRAEPLVWQGVPSAVRQDGKVTR
jgi:hypothetical protein